MGGPKAVVELISPSLAERYLGTMKENRPLSQKRVAQYARDIKAGKWLLSGETIKFDTDGHLFDGQHRLHACVRAQRNFQELVVRGLDRKAFFVVDQGAKRTLGQVLSMQGYSGPNNLAAAVVMTYQYYNGRRWREAPTIQQAEAWLKKHNSLLVDSVRTCGPPYKYLPKGVGLQPLASVHFLMAHGHDPEEATAFVHEVCIQQLSPATVAVRKALHNRVTGPNAKLQAFMALALLIKAANAWMAGEEVEIIRWSSGGSRPEVFPTLVVPKESDVRDSR